MELADVGDWLGGVAEDGAWIGKLLIVLIVFVAAMVTNRFMRRLLRRAYWRRAAVSAERGRANDLRRTRRQQTVLTVLESLNRYLIYGAAALVAIWVLAAGAASAIFGASLVIVLVGFVFQRVLWDIVAGGLLLFEGRYAVGDFVTFHTINVSGIIEEFGLRTTTLRTLEGNQITVLNGTITSFTRHGGGVQTWHVRLSLRGGDVERDLQEVLAAMVAPQRPFLTGPRLVGQRSEGDLVELQLEAVTAPTMGWLVEDALVEALRARFAERLVGRVDAWSVDERTWEGYRSSLELEPAS